MEILDSHIGSVVVHKWWFAILSVAAGFTAFTLPFLNQLNMYLFISEEKVIHYNDLQMAIPTVYKLGSNFKFLVLLCICLCFYFGRKYKNGSLALILCKKLGYSACVLAIFLLFIPFYLLAL